MRKSFMNVVELGNVTKTFGDVVAVDDLSLAVPEGSVYGFIGPNGSGKTTTLRMIMNIYYPDRGTIRVFEKPPGKSVSDRIGYLPEERGLYRKMIVRDLLLFFGHLKNGQGVSREVDYWLDRLGLSKWASRKVETLSKGMSQKVQFIATVVARPKLLILDEPFSGLDPVNAESLREAILDLRRGGTTVIFSTHDMNVAERLCDFIFMIFKGDKVLDGTLEEIQGSYGVDTLRIAVDGGAAVLDGMPGVERVRDYGQVQEVRLVVGADPQRILAGIIQKARVRKFEVVHPSLHEIFVRIAGEPSEEVVNGPGA